MLTIRLQRTGKKNQADFRIVLAEKTAPVQKKIQEVLGSYNPRKKYFKINEERLKYWLSQNAAPSPTVQNLLITKGSMEGKKVKAFNVPKKKEPSAPEVKPTETPEPEQKTAEVPKAEEEKKEDTPAPTAPTVPPEQAV